MFFYVSKFVWLLLEPSNLMILLLLLGLFWRNPWLRILPAVALIICGLTPLGALLLHPLEERFAQARADIQAPAGIIVLGGGIDEGLTLERNVVSLTEAGARMSEGVALALRYPQARLVFSGGSAAVLDARTTEANAARRMWTELGIAPARMELEDESRNTSENAVLTKALVQPKPGETWLLVTSAMHMPRSVGVFRHNGFDVTPYPVDYRTRPWPSFLRPHTQAQQNLADVDNAVKEWVGLLAYWASGRTDALFPRP